MFQGFFGGSDQNTPNAFVQSPDQIANRQRLAQSLIDQGSSTAPIASPWQGVANLAKALMGGYEAGDAQRAQRLSQANTDANRSNLYNQSGLYNDPGNLNIPATPGQTTPALQANDAANDAAADAQDGGNDPRAALAAALAKGSPAPAAVAPNRAALAAALSPAPVPPASANPMALAATLGAGTPYGTANVTNANSYPNTQDGHAAFIRDRAGALGLDPSLPLRIANAEGLKALSSANPNSASVVDRNPDGTPFSFGDFQLNVRNGLGTEARRAGIDPADPNQWQKADEYALETMAKGGLGPWKGDAAVSAYQAGGGGWNAPASGNAPAVAAINAATGGGGAPTPNPAQAGGQGGDVSGILNMLSDPNASDADRQMAQQMLQMRLPQRPSIIDGPTDPENGYPTKLIWSPTQGVLGRLNADGSIAPAGANSGTNGASSTAPKPPPGADAKTFREELGKRGAALAVPSTDDLKGLTTSARSDPAYQEADVATSTYNSMLNESKYDNHAADKALIDGFAKINNPGRAVGVGQYTINSDIQSLPDAIRGEVLKAYSGEGVLQPSTRAAILQLGRQRVDQYQNSWQTARQPFLATAQRGHVPDSAVPDIVKPGDPVWADIGRYTVDEKGVHDSKSNGALVDPQTLAPLASQPTPSVAQASPAPGARRAPDGNWYVADPARPGKYLMVH